MRKILSQDIFSHFVYMLLGCSIHVKNDFFQNDNFKVETDCSFITNVVDTGDKLIADVVYTG